MIDSGISRPSLGRGCHVRRLGAGRRMAVLAGYDLTEATIALSGQPRICPSVRRTKKPGNRPGNIEVI